MCLRADTWWENMFSVLLWIIKQRTELPLPWSIFLLSWENWSLELGEPWKRKKNSCTKAGSLSAVSRKIQSRTSLHQSSQAWPAVVSQLLSVTSKIQTFPYPFFSAAPALIKLSASLHHQDATIIHCATGRADGDSTAPDQAVGFWFLSLFL